MPLASAARATAIDSQIQTARRARLPPAAPNPASAAIPRTSAGRAKAMSPMSTPSTGSRKGPAANASTNTAEMSLWDDCDELGVEPVNGPHIDFWQVPLETNAAAAESGCMEFVHSCHFCGWQRRAQSPTIVEPNCSGCGSLLDSGRAEDFAAAVAFQPRLTPGVRLPSRAAAAIRYSLLGILLCTSSAAGLHSGGP